MAWVLIGLGVLIVIWAIATFNKLVSLRQETVNAWSQIDVQLKRRYDLIPNLVETVKGYMAHEKDTLERVIQARNMALGARSVHDKAAAETQLTTALNGFFAVAEAYPELRSNQNMLSLQEELKTTENKVSFARQYYNDVVTAYNTTIEKFPSNLIANGSGFKPKELFELDEPAARDAVKVSFT
ncbi:MAG: LemA family protein [Fimbriimonadaceae bacterium]